MDYLTTHGDGCECKADDPRYPTLCALVRAMKAERAHLAQTEAELRARLTDLLNCSSFACPYEKRMQAAEAALAAYAALVLALVVKLDAAKGPLDAVCQIAQIHGLPYTGPTYGVELAAVRAVTGGP